MSAFFSPCSSANDLLDFLAACLGIKKTPLVPAMAPRSSRAPRRARRPCRWPLLTTPGGGEIIWHNGGTGGYRSFIGFDPKACVVAVVALSRRAARESESTRA